MIESRRRYILFDFDGTLADTSSGIYQAFRFSCETVNLLPPSLDNFRFAIGPPIRQMSAVFFPNLCEEGREVFARTFRREYDARCFRSFTWYEGVLAGIPQLVLGGYRLGIVTNKPTLITERLLRESNLLTSFLIVAGIDSKGSSTIFSNKTEALRWTLKQLDICASEVIYCGDTPNDKEACRAVGVPFIASNYGFYKWADGIEPKKDGIGRSLSATSIQVFESFCEVLSYFLNLSQQD